jgi:hypothetical protein
VDEGGWREICRIKSTDDGKNNYCAGDFLFFFTVSIPSRPQSESNGSRRGRTHEFSASDLEQDQKLFADDIRKLRRDLRRGVPAAIVDFEREEVRQDWVHIIMDRGLSGAGPAPTVLDLARLPASTKRPRCCCTAEPGGPSVWNQYKPWSLGVWSAEQSSRALFHPMPRLPKEGLIIQRSPMVCAAIATKFVRVDKSSGMIERIWIAIERSCGTTGAPTLTAARSGAIEETSDGTRAIWRMNERTCGKNGEI